MQKILFIKYLTKPILMVALIISCILLLLQNIGYTHNKTASGPLGYYLTIKNSAIERNQVYQVCLDASKNKYIKTMAILGLAQSNDCSNGFIPLLKTVIGMPNDLIMVSESGVMVNNVLISHSTASINSHGINLLPIPIGYTHILQPNEYWVYGSGSSRSYDSRYFGIIKASEIKARAVLILKEQLHG